MTHSKPCIEMLHRGRVVRSHVTDRGLPSFWGGGLVWTSASALFEAVRREFWNSRKRFDAELGRVAEKVEQAHRSPSSET